MCDENAIIFLCMFCSLVGVLVGFVAAVHGFRRGAVKEFTKMRQENDIAFRHRQ